MLQLIHSVESITIDGFQRLPSPAQPISCFGKSPGVYFNKIFVFGYLIFLWFPVTFYDYQKKCIFCERYDEYLN
jgi:hypothetical protein